MPPCFNSYMEHYQNRTNIKYQINLLLVHSWLILSHLRTQNFMN